MTGGLEEAPYDGEVEGYALGFTGCGLLMEIQRLMQLVGEDASGRINAQRKAVTSAAAEGVLDMSGNAVEQLLALDMVVYDLICTSSAVKASIELRCQIIDMEEEG